MDCERKICRVCNVEKDLNKDNFYWRNDNQKWKNTCRKCLNILSNNNYCIAKYINNHPSNIDNIINIFFQFIINISVKKNHKRCRICKIEKELLLNNFNHSNGQWREECKECLISKRKEYKIYKLFSGEIKKDYGFKKCAYCNFEKELNNFHWRDDFKIWEGKCKECKAKDYQKNKKRIVAGKIKRKKERKEIDPIFMLKENASGVANRMLKSQNGSKGGKSSSKYFPWTSTEYKDHIEKLFIDPTVNYNRDNNGNFWMNWNNHGMYNPQTWDDNGSSTWTWNIDHIIPQNKLKYDTMEHPNFQKTWSLFNLRPYSAKQNIIDGERL